MQRREREREKRLQRERKSRDERSERYEATAFEEIVVAVRRNGTISSYLELFLFDFLPTSRSDPSIADSHDLETAEFH